MSRPKEFEVRGAVHSPRKLDRYGRPYAKLKDWKAEVGNIIFGECTNIKLMICGSPNYFRVTFWGDSLLIPGNIIDILLAMENEGFYNAKTVVLVPSKKVGIYFRRNEAKAKRNFVMLDAHFWLLPWLELLRIERTSWWEMFES